MCRVAAFLLVAVVAGPLARGEFRYEVRRDKFRGSEAGVLTIDASGVRYRSENEKTVLDFAFEDIRKADVSNPQKVRLFTYERAKKRLARPRLYQFKILEGTTEEALAEFLAERLERPVLGAYGIQEGAGGGIPAYHRHVLGGCDGTLRFDTNAIEFDSKNRKHSRTWVHTDIETIGTMDPFHFRLTTYAETYNFDLMQRLSTEDYRSIWRGVYSQASESQPRLVDSRSTHPYTPDLQRRDNLYYQSFGSLLSKLAERSRDGCVLSATIRQAQADRKRIY